jgi:hypothetical protein
MPTVQLDDEEWQRVLSIIATAPWNVANPLLMKIGEQLRQQQQHNSDFKPVMPPTNSGEVPVKSAQVESDKATH